MKRKLLALAVFAALATPVCADYLVIRINLSAEAQSNESGNDAARPGGGGLPGGGALPGGAGGGGAMGGKGGGRGGMAAGGGMAMGGGAAGGPGGGAPGRGGLGLGAGGGQGRPPQLGVGAGGGGAAGGRPGGNRLTPGTSGGAPGRGGAGAGDDALASGGGTGGGLPGTGQAGNEPAEMAPSKGDLFIVATEVTVSRARNSNKVIIATKWGNTVLDPDTSLPGKATMQIIKAPSLADRLSTARRDFVDGQANKDYMKLAEWMLQNWNLPADGKISMHEKFDAFLTEMTSIAPTLNATDKAKYEAMMKVKSQLAQAVSSPQEEMELMKVLLPKIGKDYRTLSRGHYLIYHHPQDDKLAEAKVAKLEQAMAGVLYWFALERNPLPMPTKQMVCVLADNADKFKSLRTMFDDVPLHSDGFYAPLDNITVLAPGRVDASFERFITLANSAEGSLKPHNNLDFRKLLTENPGKPYINTTTSKDESYVGAVVTGQIFALAKNAALDEGEVNTATYEAFEQLAGAAGFPPRAIQLPRSLLEGLGSFFATPKSSGDLNLPSLWTGIGGSHWIYFPLFRKMADARKANADKAEITVDEKTANAHRVKIGALDLMQVITDRSFDAVEKADAKDRDFLRDKAKAEAWALTYFLLYKKGDQFRKFIDELKEMPRDLDLSPEVLEQAFGRAFDLLDDKSEKIDNAKVGKLQHEWTEQMAFVNLPVNTADKK